MLNRDTIASLRQSFLDGTRKPSEVIDAALKTISERDGEIHAYLESYESAREEAREADAAYLRGDTARPLLGVPVALKNNILVEGKKATAASKILENYVATYDATVTKRLKEAGAIIVGATNLDEFAMGSSTENSAFGPTKNPLDTTRVPGGSSGGSAAAVAMGSVPVSLGTDTGGSIRLPASFCGLVGLKPTYGAVSRSGLIAMGSSLDQAGPFAHTVADAKTIFDTIRGVDTLDSTTYAPGTYPEVPTKEKYRIGIPYTFLKEGIEEDVRTVFDDAVARLTSMGHEIVDISLPYMEKGLAAYYIVMPAEVSSNLARYDGVRFGLHVEGKDLREDYDLSRGQGFGTEVKRRILLGTYVLSSGYYDAYYGKAEQVRTLMREELSNAFTSIDFVLTPTAPLPAWKFGDKNDPLSMYLADIFTVPANLTGVPALSVPAGTVKRSGVDLPIGIQLMAPHDGESRLFHLGAQFLSE